MKYILLTFALFTQPVFAEIYKWIDDSGKVHFGDSPPHEKQVEEVVVEVNSYEHVTSEHVEFYKGYSSNKVIMYSTSWCKYCKKARRYFKANGIRYVEYDIEKDQAAKQAFDKLGGKGIPLILVGKTKMTGFNVSGFEKINK